jgi:predicted Zn-dependent protease with MMP-like domain
MRLSEAEWRAHGAPDLAAFEALARRAFDGLPQQFRDLCGDMVVIVEDFAEPAVLRSLRIRDRFGLLGLFSGVARPFQSSFDLPRLPNTVHLYRRPILDYWASHKERLGDIITHVLVHEIGHHFGFSDDDMHAIEEKAD